MAKSPLFVKVGFCTDTEAHLLAVFDWNEDEELTTARLAYRVNDGEPGSVDEELKLAHPYALARFDLHGLPSGGKVTYAAVAAQDAASLDDAGTLLASGAIQEFRLLPTDRPLRVALLSCNKVRDAEPSRRYDLWNALKGQIDNEDVDLIIHAGDQIYADPIKEEAADDPYSANWQPAQEDTVNNLASKYRYYYVRNWGAPAVSSVLGSCPSIMIWDDHDVYDGWGSNDSDDSGFCQTIFEAARRAFEEFQVSTNPSPLQLDNSYACGFVHNEIGFLVLDARKNRMYKQCRVLGREQIDDVGEWLNSKNEANLKHLYVVSSIPFVHVKIGALLSILEFTPWTEELTDDIRDCWIAKNNKRDCSRILMRLFEFNRNSPNTMVTVLGGDVHVASLAQIDSRLPAHKATDRDNPRIYQVVSSGIGHPPPSGVAAFLMKRAATSTVDLVQKDIQGVLLPLEAAPGDPYILDRRNFAILKVGDEADGWDPHGNLWVEYFVEEKDGIKRYEQCLVGWGPGNP